MKKEKDVKRGSVIKDKNGILITDHNAVLHVWETYFKELLNKTEDRELELPSSVREKTEVVEITDTEMMAAMKKMKKGKATGLDVEMLDLAGDVGVNWTRRLLNSCLTEGKIPVEWRTGLIIPIWKMKGDVHDPGKYRGITLLSQVLKLLERVLDGRIRKKIECEIGEEQQGFRKGRGTTDGLFTLRQFVEKKLEKQGCMCIGFVDLEKAFHTVSRKMVMATLRWLGVPEAEVRMVEATYQQTNGRVIIGAGMSDQFSLNNGLRQGSAVSPLLFIVVMELISRNVSMKDTSRKLLYADDLAIVAEDKAELNESLEEWKEAFKQHGLRVNLEKTEVLSIGAHREELNIKLEGRTIRQNNSFIYLGGAVSSDGRSETEVRRRVQAGANAWRQVEGVMSDRHISQKLKGKVLGACVTPAMLYGLDTLPVTEKHQHRLQVCENSWVRRIAGVKRLDRRRMDELREEVGIEKCLMGRLVKSRM